MICPRCGKPPVLAMNCVLSGRLKELEEPKDILMFCTRDHGKEKDPSTGEESFCSCGHPFRAKLQVSDIRVGGWE
jgi:hypothetical protein